MQAVRRVSGHLRQSLGGFRLPSPLTLCSRQNCPLLVQGMWALELEDGQIPRSPLVPEREGSWANPAWQLILPLYYKKAAFWQYLVKFCLHIIPVVLAISFLGMYPKEIHIFTKMNLPGLLPFYRKKILEAS